MRAALLALAACTKPVPTPTTIDVTRANAAGAQVTLAALERGRALYVQRCGNCHQPYQPSDYPPAAWPRHVDEMAERAKLGTDDRMLITQFLVTLAGR
jgi:mono/diheme cytochrome c family protein